MAGMGWVWCDRGLLIYVLGADRCAMLDSRRMTPPYMTPPYMTHQFLTRACFPSSHQADVDPDTFYPKCYDLADADDREAFVRYYVKVSE